ncbi:MAG: aldo/keto reductase [Geminicoccaceae bacterium]
MHLVTVRDARIPALGFGTFRLNGRTAHRMVAAALEIGYRHIDTAQMYGNEAEVGQALAESGVPREEIWLTTKIWPDNLRARDLERAAGESVRRLRTAPDLLLLHWPNPKVPLEETMGALNQAKREGLARHIGISNFTSALIREAVALSEEPLLLDQVEYHPFLGQRAVLEELARHRMALTAYAPIAHGKVFGDATLRRISERHGKTAGQVALRWLIQQDRVLAIPGSSREEHARANFEIFDFALSEDEMGEISRLGRPDGRLISPGSTAPDWDRS